MRQADAAHEETKQRLIASELAVRSLEGELAEAGETAKLFHKPANKLTEEYISGHFG